MPDQPAPSLGPWVDLDGLTERLNSLMREEWDLVDAIGEMLAAGVYEDVSALLSMLIETGKKIDNPYQERFTR